MKQDIKKMNNKYLRKFFNHLTVFNKVYHLLLEYLLIACMTTHYLLHVIKHFSFNANLSL